MLSLHIAFRYLRAKKSHRAVNVITMVAVVGIAVATMAMVLVLSIFNGFSDLAEKQLSALDPELAVASSHGKIIENADSVARIVSAVAGVAQANPVVWGKAMLVDGDLRVPVEIKGIQFTDTEAAKIERIIIAGEYATANTYGTPAVQLAVGVANRVRQAPGGLALMNLIVPRRSGRINPANPSAAFRSEEVVFSGVFRIDNPDIDGSTVIMPLEAARQLLDYDSEASQIDVLPVAGLSTSNLRKTLADALGEDFKVLTRVEQRADAFRMISVEKWVTFMMLIAILVIALFNVVSTLSLLAIEKRDNMRTLRALGASMATVRNVFISEGVLVTCLGGLIGICAGVILALMQQWFHFVKLNADSAALTIDYYPVRVEPSDILVIAAVVVALAFVVSVITRLILPRKNTD